MLKVISLFLKYIYVPVCIASFIAIAKDKIIKNLKTQFSVKLEVTSLAFDANTVNNNSVQN